MYWREKHVQDYSYSSIGSSGGFDSVSGGCDSASGLDRALFSLSSVISLRSCLVLSGNLAYSISHQCLYPKS